MLGVHVHKNTNIHDDIIDAVKSLKINTVQIFTHGPRSSTTNNIDIDKLAKLEDILIYVHSTYISSPWNGTPYSSKHISDQLKTCSLIRAEGFVIHLRKDTISNITNKLKGIISHGQKIILEAPAMKAGPLTFESASRLNELCHEIRKFATPSQVGICIDTSHQTAGGIDLSSYTSAETFLKELQYPEYIALIHLNGTSYPLGSGRDMHEVAFSKSDIIWKRYNTSKISSKYNIYNSGVAAIVKFCKQYSVPIILEVNREASPGDTKHAIKRLKTLYNKK